jgi:hypothetical protein
VPKGLEDVSKYPYLLAELLLDSDRWSEDDIAKLAGKNLIRVFRQVEKVSFEGGSHARISVSCLILYSCFN